MDYLTTIATLSAFLIGVIFSYFFIPKFLHIKNVGSSHSTEEDINVVQDYHIINNKLSNVEGKFADSEIKISKLKTEIKLDEEDEISENIIVKKFKNKINNLNDEIEEMQDEISDLKLNNIHVKQEFSDLDDRFYQIQKEKKIISDDNKKYSEKIRSIENEIKNKNQSLSFISDILNANNAIDEDFAEVDHKTWGIYTAIKNDLKYGLENFGNNFISDDFIDDCLNWRNREIKTWIKNKRVVAIVGEFSAGKTSIVNRILKQDDPNAVELPVHSSETTAIPTYISKGIDFNCQFFSPSGELKNISAESFQRVTKSMLDEIDISSLVKYFVLSYDNPYLSDISILDTPGFGSNSKEIESKTTEVIQEADVLFWVVDAHTGTINDSSINVIKENLKDVPLFIIINKSDCKSQSDLKLLQQSILKTLEKNNIECQEIICFSQKHNVDEIMRVLNKIPCKKNPNLILQVKEQILMTKKDAADSLKKYKSELSRSKQNVENCNFRLNGTMKTFKNSILDIDAVVKKVEPNFRKDFYKILETDYGRFSKARDKILHSSNDLSETIETLQENVVNRSEKLEDIKEKKIFIKSLCKSEENFLKLVKDYNPKLIN